MAQRVDQRDKGHGDLYVNGFTYDTSFRLTRMQDTKAANPTLRDVSLTYTLRDDIATVSDALTPANNETLAYQNRQFLGTATGNYGPLSWTYDAVGNRSTQVLGGVTDAYTYPAASNRLTSVSNAKHALGYDAGGNVVSDTQGANAWTYVYNSANRMESVSKNAVNQGTYVYNAMGQKVRRVAGGVTTNAIHDVQGRRIAEYNASGNLLIREYLWLGDKPVAVVEGGTVFYIRADNINRPVFATNAAGVKVWSASYLPFGGVATSTGTPISLRFPGQWFELESGLHQNWMRDYDPTTGRYLQADPLGLVDGASLYGYARGNPFRYTDPTGEIVPLAIAVYVVGGALVNVAIGYGIDQWFGDGCYSLGEFAFDVVLGALLGPGFAPIDGSLLRGATRIGDAAVVAGKSVVGAGDTAVVRTSRSGEKAVTITRPDGSVIDISPARVKEYVPNTHPNAPSGALNRVKFPESLLGSKGYKRAPTAAELDFLRGVK